MRAVISCILILTAVFNHKDVDRVKDTQLEPTGILSAEGRNYVAYIVDSRLMVYSSRGELIDNYPVKNKGKAVISICISDLDNNGSSEILMVTGEKGDEYGEKLVILTLDGKLKEIYEYPIAQMNPWKVQTADVDGDGIKEISISMYKKTEFHPVMAKRPYLYNWHDGSIFPKWRGSRLARPFEDYTFSDLDMDGMDELVSIEILSDGREVLNVYKWKGFGFEGIGESHSFEDISDIKKGDKGDGDVIHARVKERYFYKWVSVYYENGKLKTRQ